MEEKSKSDREKERFHRAWDALDANQQTWLFLKALWMLYKRRATVRVLLALLGQFFVMLAAVQMDPYQGIVFWLISSLVIVGWFMSPSLKRLPGLRKYHWVEADEQTVRRH